MIKYLFPFEKVEKGSRIILYGAGVVGRNFYEQCHKTKYCNIVLWVDKKWYLKVETEERIRVSDITEIEKYSSQCDAVVIAVNDVGIKDEIVQYLSNYFVQSKIIWRKPDIIEENHWERSRRTAGKLCNIIPDFEYKKNSLVPDFKHKKNILIPDGSDGTKFESLSQPVRVRFIVDTHYWWNVAVSVAKEYLQDTRYDVLIVGNGHWLRKNVQKDIMEDGFRLETSRDYDVQKDCPDIVFVVNKVVDNKLVSMCNCAKLVIGIPGTIIKWDGCFDIKHFLPYVYSYLNIKADYYLFDKLLFNEMENAGLTTEQTILLGNPKFDHIYGFMKKEAIYPPEWEKLKNKKVILWTTDHQCFSYNVSFDFYAKSILEFFEKNPELGLIFRPHPLYFEEMLNNKIWTQKDMEIFRTYMRESPNMVWDDQPSYSYAYRICNAVMADADCGIICSSLPLGVPVAALTRPEKTRVTQPELISHLYHVRNIEELKNFFEVVGSGIDPKKEERLQAFHDNILFYDGKIGKRIKEFVSEKYEEKCRNIDFPK